MKGNQSKLKIAPRNPLFSCGLFRQCTQNVLSPTTSTPPPLPQVTALPPPPPPAVKSLPESSSSSSSNTSQSFTQWRFPLSYPSISQHSYSQSRDEGATESQPKTAAAAGNASLKELFHAVELQFQSGSDACRFGAVQLLEKSLVPEPRASVDACSCPAAVMGGVVACLRDGVARKSASKSLLALCLVEGNRPVAVEAGAVTAVVEALTDAENAVVERSLAALELLCTTSDGAAEVRAHALAVPMMVQVMGRMDGRGKEHALSVLGVIYGGLDEDSAVAPAEEVARAVVLALQGDCSARGRRKGAQLLKILQKN